MHRNDVTGLRREMARNPDTAILVVIEILILKWWLYKIFGAMTTLAA